MHINKIYFKKIGDIINFKVNPKFGIHYKRLKMNVLFGKTYPTAWLEEYAYYFYNNHMSILPTVPNKLCL